MIANALADSLRGRGYPVNVPPSRPAQAGVIGIVVVTHGNLAGELVNAARTIVGEIPRIAAVVHRLGRRGRERARRPSRRALAEVGADGALVLTDMFGGTPTNLSLPSLSARVEIVTGVNLPMLIKLTAQREGDLKEVARVIRDQGKGAIYVASEFLEKKAVIQPRGARCVNRLGMHARAAARFVHTASRSARASPCGATTAPWTASRSWASCCWPPPRARASRWRRRARTRGRRSTRWRRSSRSGFGEEA